MSIFGTYVAYLVAVLLRFGISWHVYFALASNTSYIKDCCTAVTTEMTVVRCRAENLLSARYFVAC